MLRRAAIVVLLLLAIGVPPARADDRTVVAAGLRFVDARDGLQPVEITEGDTLTFVNADPVSLTDGHNVTHDAPLPLFASDTILVGSTTHVPGVENLSPGDYPFMCTIHPGMAGTLRVLPAMPGY